MKLRVKSYDKVIVKETHWAIEKAEESFCLKVENRTVWGENIGKYHRLLRT